MQLRKLEGKETPALLGELRLLARKQVHPREANTRAQIEGARRKTDDTKSSVANVPDVQLCLETPLSAAYLEYITRLPSYVGQIVAHVL